MAKYQQYDKYKDSGVDVLGSIPTQWKISKLAYTFLKANAGEVIDKTYWGSGKEVLYTCNKTPLLSDYIGFPEEKRTTENDLLLTRNGTPYVHKPIEGSIYSNVVQRITLSAEFDRNYLTYCLGNSALSLKGYGVSIESFNFETWKSMQFATPSMKEQKQVVNFLDYETAQIDTLIEKQQTLIQLLREKRQAVVSHAVTKGLNPDAPMKDSGVEWLGEVPEHWIVTKFSHCAQIRNGLVDPKAPDFKKLVLYAPNHIEKGTGKIVYKETAEEQGADSSKYLCYKGEVIYSKIRPALAKVAICEEETALCSADMYPINAVNGLDNRFLYFFMLSDNFTKAAILDSDRVAMPKINRESLSDYRLPVPPVIEQMAICKFIANQNTKLEELESKATKAIQLMQERRTALISAAVTGKIDVRGWVAPENEVVF